MRKRIKNEDLDLKYKALSLRPTSDLLILKPFIVHSGVNLTLYGYLEIVIGGNILFYEN